MEKNGSAFEEWNDQLRWFMDHYQGLARKYDGQNVCVYKRRVVDHDRDLRRLMKRVRGRFPQEKGLGRVCISQEIGVHPLRLHGYLAVLFNSQLSRMIVWVSP